MLCFPSRMKLIRNKTAFHELMLLCYILKRPSVDYRHIRVHSSKRVRAYPVLCHAVEEGVAYGWRRAHKHIDAPDAQTIEDQIVDAVLSEVCQYFDFDEDAEVQLSQAVAGAAR